MKKEDTQEHLQIEEPRFFPCQKIKPGTYKYRGWIIQCVGYYEPERCVVWEAYDPETGCADFHAFSKKAIKSLIDESPSKNDRQQET